MKVGDNVPVTLAGHVVAQARVSELGDGKAVLVIPGTQVTMAVRTELDAAPAPQRDTETIVTGVDRAEGDTAATDETQTEAPKETQNIEATGAAEAVTPDPADNVTSPDAGGTETQVADASVETVEPSEQA